MHDLASPSPTPDALTRLRSRWLTFIARVGATRIDAVAADALFLAIESLYAHPPRAYHNLTHIAACLDVLDAHRALASQPEAIELALWLHDCVYVPGRTDNESRSATIAAMFARELNLAPHAIANIAAWIMATRHDVSPRTMDEALILDIDIAILGSPVEQYAAYTRAIRTEFGFATDDQFRTGRDAFVRAMLDRDTIFHTARFRAIFEANARSNLRGELA